MNLRVRDIPVIHKTRIIFSPRSRDKPRLYSGKIGFQIRFIAAQLFRFGFLRWPESPTEL